MGPLGWQETIFIFVFALLIFGPKKLPELGKTIGKALTEFRRASSELKSTWDREMAAVEKESESLKSVTNDYAREISGAAEVNCETDSPYDYEYGSDYYDPGPASNTSTVGASAPEGAELTAEAGDATEGKSTSAETSVAGSTSADPPAQVEPDSVRT